jgi:uncharacterized protein (TIGR02271 family)
MLEQNQIDQVTGTDLYGSDGEKIGKVGQVYLDDQTGQPEWVTVSTGLFGTNESFVPLRDAAMSGDRLTVPYDKDKVKDAPNVDVDRHLSEEEEQQLFRHYGVDWGQNDTTYSDTTTTTGVSGLGDEGTAMTGSAGRTDDAMTRSEERVEVGTESHDVGRARLRKYVVTEDVTQTVPVRREKAVLETEPITSENIDKATDGPEITEAEHEVVLSEERPVVSKVTEPVERVKLGTEEVTEQETVTEEVRKERIETEGDIANR